jgi:hypothetical protein
MSLLGPKALKALRDPRHPWVIRVCRTSRVRHPVLQALAISHRTWEVGAVVEPPVLRHSAACHIRPQGGFLRDKNSRPWVMVRGIRISSSLALGFLPVPLALPALLDKVDKPRVVRLVLKHLSKSQLQSDLLPTGNPRPLLNKPGTLLDRRP